MPQTHPQAQWQLQTAKAHLSQLVEAALGGEPQRITRRGKDCVVVLSEASFLSLKQSAKSETSNLISHLLAMPREKALKTKRVSESNKVTTSRLGLRDIEL